MAQVITLTVTVPDTVDVKEFEDEIVRRRWLRGRVRGRIGIVGR